MADTNKEVLNQTTVPVLIIVLKSNKKIKEMISLPVEAGERITRKDEKRWRSLALVDVPLEEEAVPGRSLHPSCLKSAAYWTTGSAENIK